MPMIVLMTVVRPVVVALVVVGVVVVTVVVAVVEPEVVGAAVVDAVIKLQFVSFNLIPMICCAPPLLTMMLNPTENIIDSGLPEPTISADTRKLPDAFAPDSILPSMEPVPVTVVRSVCRNTKRNKGNEEKSIVMQPPEIREA